jgi:glycosyltransferase involved in cell wall biosynthesis
MHLAIITTHPIQYYAPVFKLIAERCNLKVFYTWGEEGAKPKYDPGFGKAIEWDLPLLAGYNYEFLKNISKQPGSNHFKGIINPDIIKKVNGFKPDAILLIGWSYSSHLKVMRHFKGSIPVWFRGDSTLLDSASKWKQVLRQIALKWIYSYIDRAFYVGSANKAYFKKCGLKESQLVFAPHAIDNERFSENRQIEALDFRKYLNIQEADILVLFAGKLEIKKDPKILLKAFAELGRENIHLLFVGNGVLEDELKSKCEELTNPALVHFLPFQNQQTMPVIYQSCDLFCLPSKGPGETWGLAVNEAMACSKAVLVSDKVGCAVDLVKEGYNGAIFKAGSLASLTQHLTQLINMGKENFAGMGLNSKKIISDWTFEKQVSAIESAIING